MLKLKHIVLLFLLCFGIHQTAFAQIEIPKKPSFIPPVIDSTKTLNKSQHDYLYEKLKNYSDSTSTEIVIAIVETTHGENIDYYGTNWAHKWEIGQEKEDNGVFLLLAIKDRKVAIKTGYGVEHLLTDAISKRIIERDIIPYFKQGDYYGGLNKGTDAIFKVLKGEYQNTKQSSHNGVPIGFILFLILIFIIILIAISKNRRNGGNSGNRGNRGNRSEGLDILEAIILSNSGRGSYRRSSGGFGGWSGGSSSGGGFGGFGSGGGFGGGGASGGW